MWVCSDFYIHSMSLCHTALIIFCERPFASFFSRRAAACRSIGMCVLWRARSCRSIWKAASLALACSESRTACERRQRATCILHSALGAVTLRDPESNSIIWPPPGSAQLPTNASCCTFWLYIYSCSYWKQTSLLMQERAENSSDIFSRSKVLIIDHNFPAILKICFINTWF